MPGTPPTGASVSTRHAAVVMLLATAFIVVLAVLMSAQLRPPTQAQALYGQPQGITCILHACVVGAGKQQQEQPLKAQGPHQQQGGVVEEQQRAATSPSAAQQASSESPSPANAPAAAALAQPEFEPALATQSKAPFPAANSTAAPPRTCGHRPLGQLLTTCSLPVATASPGVSSAKLTAGCSVAGLLGALQSSQHTTLCQEGVGQSWLWRRRRVRQQQHVRLLTPRNLCR